jgi:uncharacterized membrane protein SpoIIM required for sporulation/uncharacterized RDD family membrane protein YckC
LNTPASVEALADRQVRIETPEHVAVGYRLADLGSRFTALVLDGLLLLVLLLAFWLGIPFLVGQVGPLPAMVAGWGMGALVLIGFVLTWGYFVFFEAFRGGQTPGKRAIGIRVVHDGGYPLTLRGAAIRNLLRVVDSQPAFSWLIGGGVMLLHPSTKRLGDLAAGTIVVRERSILYLPEELTASAPTFGAPRLRDDEFAALSTFVARQDALHAEVRTSIAGRIAKRLEHAEPWDRRRESATDHLLRLHADEAARRSAAGLGGAAGSARSVQLVRGQQRTWQELRELLGRASSRGLAGLGPSELSRFAAVYRETSADLARARTYGGSPELLHTLERLVGEGHNVLYRSRAYSLRQVREWIGSGFPRLVRARWRPIALSAIVFYLPAALAFSAARNDPAWARQMLPVEMVARAETGHAREAQGTGYVEVPDVFMPVMASSIIANNVQVTFLAFAGGVLAGAGTLLILVFNGVFLGAVAGLFASEGLSLYLWSFVLPHGVIELTAICIAGGAGFLLGSAVLAPGRQLRREALVQRGHDAVALIGGTTVLLIIAGVIEGFISPAPIDRSLKLAAAALFAAVLVVYLGFGGRRGRGDVR